MQDMILDDAEDCIVDFNKIEENRTFCVDLKHVMWYCHNPSQKSKGLEVTLICYATEITLK